MNNERCWVQLHLLQHRKYFNGSKMWEMCSVEMEASSKLLVGWSLSLSRCVKISIFGHGHGRRRRCRRHCCCYAVNTNG